MCVVVNTRGDGYLSRAGEDRNYTYSLESALTFRTIWDAEEYCLPEVERIVAVDGSPKLPKGCFSC
jgi:hypothetical protein